MFGHSDLDIDVSRRSPEDATSSVVGLHLGEKMDSRPSLAMSLRREPSAHLLGNALCLVARVLVVEANDSRRWAKHSRLRSLVVAGDGKLQVAAHVDPILGSPDVRVGA